MGLKKLPSRLQTLRPSTAFMPVGGKQRDKARASDAGRKLYFTGKWKRLRLRVFLRDMFTCQRCGHVEHDTAKLVGNHKVPHKGDERLFFDEDNVETTCKPCHDSVVQQAERRDQHR